MTLTCDITRRGQMISRAHDNILVHTAHFCWESIVLCHRTNIELIARNTLTDLRYPEVWSPASREKVYRYVRSNQSRCSDESVPQTTQPIELIEKIISGWWSVVSYRYECVLRPERCRKQTGKAIVVVGVLWVLRIKLSGNCGRATAVRVLSRPRLRRCHILNCEIGLCWYIIGVGSDNR